MNEVRHWLVVRLRFAALGAIALACALLVEARGDPPRFPAEGRRAEVVLVPLGTVSCALLGAVAAELERQLQVEVRRIDPIPLPESAFYEPRRRYRAERLLRHLDRLPEATGRTRILGITEVDISTTHGRHIDWGIFGYATIGGRSGVFSSHRLGGSARNQEHFFARVATTAVHELGHVLGLPHCPTENCIMADAKGSVRPVDAATGICASCLIRLDRLAPVVRAESESER